MNCEECLHGVVMNAALDRDSELRGIISCDLIRREVRRLVECSRYEGMKKGVVEEVKIESQIVDLGYGAVSKLRGRGRPKKI